MPTLSPAGRCAKLTFESACGMIGNIANAERISFTDKVEQLYTLHPGMAFRCWVTSYTMDDLSEMQYRCLAMLVACQMKSTDGDYLDFFARALKLGRHAENLEKQASFTVLKAKLAARAAKMAVKSCSRTGTLIKKKK